MALLSATVVVVVDFVVVVDIVVVVVVNVVLALFVVIDHMLRLCCVVVGVVTISKFKEDVIFKTATGLN